MRIFCITSSYMEFATVGVEKYKDNVFIMDGELLTNGFCGWKDTIRVKDSDKTLSKQEQEELAIKLLDWWSWNEYIFIEKSNEEVKDYKLIIDNENWAPGKEIIENELKRIYGDQNPIWGNKDYTPEQILNRQVYLEGCSIYSSNKGYKHIISYGMTQLYINENAIGKEWSKWGYEMTMKLKEDVNNCGWVVNLMYELANYTNTSSKYFEPYQYLAWDGTSLKPGADSKITGLITIYDTELKSQESVYGKVEFMQLVGVTEVELQAIIKNPDRVHELIEKMKIDNPDFVTDMNRTKSYIE